MGSLRTTREAVKRAAGRLLTMVVAAVVICAPVGGAVAAPAANSAFTDGSVAYSYDAPTLLLSNAASREWHPPAGPGAVSWHRLSSVHDRDTYDAPAYTYAASVELSSPNTATIYVRGSPSGPDVASREGSASARGCCVTAEGDIALFRGMRGAADGSPELGSLAKTLGARPGRDIPVDEGGMVRPGTGGMSVNDTPTGMPEYRRPPSFGGSGKDLNMYCISSCDLGPGLRYVPESGVTSR